MNLHASGSSMQKLGEPGVSEIVLRVCAVDENKVSPEMASPELAGLLMVGASGICFATSAWTAKEAMALGAPIL